MEAEPVAAPSPPSRRERRKLEMRMRILEAAVALFDARGYEATTVAEIAERADVAAKTLFNHFPTKAHLLQAIAEHAMDEQLAGFEELRKRDLTTGERIVALFEWVAERANEAGAMRPELVHEIIRFTHASEAHGVGEARKLHDAFAAIVRDGLAAGEVTREHDEETLVEMLLGAYYAVMLSWTNFDGYPLRERARAAGRFLADAVTVERGEGG
jgi:AcrR family transcriptional regulator